MDVHGKTLNVRGACSHAAMVVAFVSCLWAASVTQADDVKFLSQNWNEEARQNFYTANQGSQIMPYEWFLALERADSTTSFSADGLARFGYIPNPNTDQNPNKLPVGFVKDEYKGKSYIGLTCAACHTNQIEYNGNVWQIDGAPALADMYEFISGIDGAVKATLDDPQKFDRFADQVGGRRNRLRKDVENFSSNWHDFIEHSTSPVPWGRARLDAFGLIFNRVAAIDLGVEANNGVPDAPVSYPFLWGTTAEDKVQWNGAAPNTHFVSRLGRNVGEVLGVFAQADLKRPRFLRHYFRTSAKRYNQWYIEEELLKNLWSPQWPSEFPQIDDAKKAKGKELFKTSCVMCHEIVKHGDQKRPVEVIMTWIKEVGSDPEIEFPPDSKPLGTDINMARNAAGRTVETAHLEGARQFLSRDKFPAKMPAGEFLGQVVLGALLDRRDGGVKFLVKTLANEAAMAIDEKSEAKEATGLLGIDERLSEYREKSIEHLLGKIDDSGDRTKKLAYKGRPMDGIWATAPYLHNGSVANLYEILLPPEQRLKSFYVGSRKFDPKKVGFETGQADGTTEFDTTLDGNSNSGHDYGNASFTPEERWALVEYMKSL